jgi:hypothetical protein
MQPEIETAEMASLPAAAACAAGRELYLYVKVGTYVLDLRARAAFRQIYVAEKGAFIDLVARLAEIKPFGKRLDLMARLQRDLPTYIAATNCFSIDHGDVDDFTKKILGR